MEKIALLELYIESMKIVQVNTITDSNIIAVLNELSKLDPICLSNDNDDKLLKNLPLLPNIYNDQVLAAACNVIASLCLDDLARNYFGKQTTVSVVNILKSLSNCTTEEKSFHECLLQTCRAVGNLCYYHEENTKHALKEECLLITMKILRTNTKDNIYPVLIGLLLNLTHLDDYDYKFPGNMIEELNSFGILFIKSNSNNYRFHINLISLIINVVRKSSSNRITDYEKCSVIDWLLENYYTNINIASICVKFIKKVSKTYNVYNWILKGKHKLLIQMLDTYEANEEKDAKHIVKKICDIITLLSNDDGCLDNKNHLEVLYIVEWLLTKINSKNLYIKLSAVRSLGNFSRFKYGSNNTIINPANNIIKHMPWFINTLNKSLKDKNTLMEVSILCLFKNMLYVTNFESMDENEKDELIKTTIEILDTTTFNPVIIKTMEVIEYIIKKGGMSNNQLVLYKHSSFIKIVTTHCNNVNEEIKVLAKKLLYTINEDIHSIETDILHSVNENLQIKD